METKGLLSLGLTVGMFLGNAAFAATPKPTLPPKKPDASVFKIAGVRAFPKTDWETRHLDTAKVGDFAEYVNAKGDLVERLTVVALEDHALTVKIGTELDGKGKEKIQFFHYEYKLPDAEAGPGNAFRNSDDKIDVVGKEQPVHLLELTYNNKPVWQEWYSDDVPLGGLVKRAGSEGKVQMVLKEYKRGK